MTPLPRGSSNRRVSSAKRRTTSSCGMSSTSLDRTLSSSREPLLSILPASAAGFSPVRNAAGALLSSAVQSTPRPEDALHPQITGEYSRAQNVPSMESARPMSKGGSETPNRFVDWAASSEPCSDSSKLSEANRAGLGPVIASDALAAVPLAAAVAVAAVDCLKRRRRDSKSSKMGRRLSSGKESELGIM